MSLLIVYYVRPAIMTMLFRVHTCTGVTIAHRARGNTILVSTREPRRQIWVARTMAILMRALT
jgi:hypothetical protein